MAVKLEREGAWIGMCLWYTLHNPIADRVGCTNALRIDSSCIQNLKRKHESHLLFKAVT
jgi:hypothetical protein